MEQNSSVRICGQMTRHKGTNTTGKVFSGMVQEELNEGTEEKEVTDRAAAGGGHSWGDTSKLPGLHVCFSWVSCWSHTSVHPNWTSYSTSVVSLYKVYSNKKKSTSQLTDLSPLPTAHPSSCRRGDHVSDGHWPCKSLGQLSKAIEGVKVRAFAISCQRLTVKFDPINGFTTWLI